MRQITICRAIGTVTMHRTLFVRKKIQQHVNDVIYLFMKNSEEWIERVHSQQYFREVMKCEVSNRERRNLLEKCNTSHDMYLSRGSRESMLNAAGGVVTAVQEVANGTVQLAFAVVRPPGHHASREKAEGFCWLNNMAIGAAYLLDVKKYNKILIVDWDIHHGNGTQSIFESDPRVLYFSIHRYGTGFYPETGNFDETGSGDGLGYTINVPLVGKYFNNNEYCLAWDLILLPIARQYKPQIILISARFDAAVGDPIGLSSITPSGYAMLLKKIYRYIFFASVLLMQIEGKIVLVLEGGYNLEALSACVTMCICQLLGNHVTIDIDQSNVRGYVEKKNCKVQSYLAKKFPNIWTYLAEHNQESVSTFNPVPGLGASVQPSVTRRRRKHIRPFFPVKKIKCYFRRRLNLNAAIYISAVLKYLIMEVLGEAGDETRACDKKRITSTHIFSAVCNDRVLRQLLDSVIFRGAGVVPKG